MKTSESISKIAPALLKAQRKMGSATKGASNPYFKSRYADLGAVMEVVKDPLNEENIVILQPAYSKDGSHYVETSLIHESGEYITSEPLKLELTKIDMQALGSAITYARRYTLQSLLGVPAEDDDAESTMNRKSSTKASQESLMKNSGGTHSVLTTLPGITITNVNADLPLSLTSKNTNTAIDHGKTLTISNALAPTTNPISLNGTAPKTSFRKSAPKINI